MDPPWATAPERAPGGLSRGCQGSLLLSGSPGAAGAQLLHGTLGEPWGNLCPWSSSCPALIPAGLVLTRVPPSSPTAAAQRFSPSWDGDPRGGSSSRAGLGPGTAGLEPAGAKFPLGPHREEGKDRTAQDGKGGITMERRDHCGKEGSYGKEGSLWEGLRLPFSAAARSTGDSPWEALLGQGCLLSGRPGGEGRGGEGAAPGRAVLSPAPPVPGAVLAVPRQLRSPGCPGLSLAPRPGSAPRDLHFMFPLWCYFCSTLPLSSVLSCLSFVSWAASHPLFVLCRTLLHPSPLLLLYSLCVFLCLLLFLCYSF